MKEQLIVPMLHVEPHTFAAHVRDTDPITWVPPLGAWLVTSHALAERILRDSAMFTVDHPRFSTAQGLGPTMVSRDGNEHDRLRKPFAKKLRRSAVRSHFSDEISEQCMTIINVFASRGFADFRSEFAGPVAVSTMTYALGIHDVDPADLRSWCSEVGSTISDVAAGKLSEFPQLSASRHLRGALERSVCRPQRAPILSAVEPDALLASEIVSNGVLLAIAGIDTTEGMITNALFHLFSNPDQLGLVLADPQLISQAVEESLRLEPAASIFERYATDDLRIGGIQIARDDKVLVSVAGANRDPTVFESPERYDILRPNLRRHLSFAIGAHYCLGAHLARLEAEIAIRLLLEAVATIQIDTERTDKAFGLMVRTPASVQAFWRDRTDSTKENEGFWTTLV